MTAEGRFDCCFPSHVEHSGVEGQIIDQTASEQRHKSHETRSSHCKSLLNCLFRTNADDENRFFTFILQLVFLVKYLHSTQSTEWMLWGYYFDWEEIKKSYSFVLWCILLWTNNYSTNSPVHPHHMKYNTADLRSRTCRVWADWPIPFMALWRISASCLALKLTNGLTLPLYACRRRDTEDVLYI